MGFISVVYVTHTIPVMQHSKPYILVNKVVDLKGSLQYLAWGAGACFAPSLVPEQFLQHFPAQFKLDLEFINDPTHYKLVFQVLLVRL